MELGEAVVDWLKFTDAYSLYDHRGMHEARAFGIEYDETIQQLAYEGIHATLQVHTPRGLMKHPRMRLVTLNTHADLWMIGAEMAQALHRLLWPVACPPSLMPGVTLERGYQLDVESISWRKASQRYSPHLEPLYGLDPQLAPALPARRTR
jgi:hypothetical protein